MQKSIITILAAWLLASVATLCYAQQRPIQITSPQWGTIVRPGDVVQVTVSNQNPLLFSSEVVMSANIPPSDVKISASQVGFSLRIPENTPNGPIFVFATAFSKDHQSTDSEGLKLIVSTKQAMIDLLLETKKIILAAPGDQAPILAKTSTSDGIKWVNNRMLSFSTTNPGVASVSVDGNIIAQSQGSTVINIQPLDTSSTATASIIVLVLGGNTRGDINGDGIVDLRDITKIRSLLNTPATSPNDARDLNRDGKIDALDLRVLTTLCTYPRCASTKP